MRHNDSSSVRRDQPATFAERIRLKLEAALAPERLEIEDQSHLHAGHSGARPGGQTHYSIKVASPRFIGKGRVERHRMVYALLTEEIADGVHAIAIHAQAPGED
jgi:BolA family transcriptional regulator, general stress-responsive regulator